MLRVIDNIDDCKIAKYQFRQRGELTVPDHISKIEIAAIIEMLGDEDSFKNHDIDIFGCCTMARYINVMSVKGRSIIFLDYGFIEMIFNSKIQKLIFSSHFDESDRAASSFAHLLGISVNKAKGLLAGQKIDYAFNEMPMQMIRHLALMAGQELLLVASADAKADHSDKLDPADRSDPYQQFLQDDAVGHLRYPLEASTIVAAALVVGHEVSHVITAPLSLLQFNNQAKWAGEKAIFRALLNMVGAGGPEERALQAIEANAQVIERAFQEARHDAVGLMLLLANCVRSGDDKQNLALAHLAQTELLSNNFLIMWKKAIMHFATCNSYSEQYMLEVQGELIVRNMYALAICQPFVSYAVKEYDITVFLDHINYQDLVQTYRIHYMKLEINMIFRKMNEQSVEEIVAGAKHDPHAPIPSSGPAKLQL